MSESASSGSAELSTAEVIFVNNTDSVVSVPICSYDPSYGQVVHIDLISPSSGNEAFLVANAPITILASEELPYLIPIELTKGVVCVPMSGNAEYAYIDLLTVIKITGDCTLGLQSDSVENPNIQA